MYRGRIPLTYLINKLYIVGVDVRFMGDSGTIACPHCGVVMTWTYDNDPTYKLEVKNG